MTLDVSLGFFKMYFGDLQTIYKNKLPKDIAITPDFAANAIMGDPRLYFAIPETLQTNKKVVKAALIHQARTGVNYEDLPEDLKSDKEIAMQAVLAKHSVFPRLPPELRGDIEFIKVVLQEKDGGWFYNYLPYELRDNRELIKLAITSIPLIFCNLKEPLRGDREIAVLAIKSAGRVETLSPRSGHGSIRSVLGYMTPEIKDFPMMLLAVKCGLSYHHLPEEFKQDEDIALAAVKKNPDNYDRLPPHLQDDNIIVMAYKKVQEAT